MNPIDNNVNFNTPPSFDNGSDTIVPDVQGSSNPWKMVSIGGIGGLLVGAGAMYATGALASNKNSSDATEDALETASSSVADMSEKLKDAAEAEKANEPQEAEDKGKQDTTVEGKTAANNTNNAEVERVTVVEHVTVVQHQNAPIYQDAPIAYNVDDHMSFSEAFAAARAEVGPGGVFSWHGGVYGTYYENEWNQMSNTERNLYAQSVHTEYDVSQVDTYNLADANNPHVDINVHVTVDDNSLEDVVGTTEPTDVQVDHNVIDVDGQTMDVYTTDVDGQTVAYVDVDNDGSLDLAMADVNGNGIPDTGEILDLNSGEFIDMPHTDVNLNDATFDDGTGFTIESDVNLI